MVARGDGQKVYVLPQGDGKLSTIDTATDTVTSSLPTCLSSSCAGPNFILYDAHLQRLYVTNPANTSLSVFSATAGPVDTPRLLSASTLAAGPVPGSYPPA